MDNNDADQLFKELHFVDEADDDPAAVKELFRQRRRRYWTALAIIGTVLAVWLVVCVSIKTAKPALVQVGILFGLWVSFRVSYGLARRWWRCPACGGRLGWFNLNPKICLHCREWLQEVP